jgi:signal transduction histidine kinase
MFLSVLMLVSLIGVGVSFVITQQVNSSLSEINIRSVPMQRELTQLSSDTELLKRELDRSLGFSHWSDSRWKPKRIPAWALEVHRSTLERIKKGDLVTPSWKDWYSRVLRMNTELSDVAEQLYLDLHERNFDLASEVYPEWIKQLEMLQKETEWAKREIDRETRGAFKEAQNSVQNLRLVLQLLLLEVICVALTMMWMGERALRPIGRLRKIVQQITERGHLTAQERSELPIIPLNQQDEVSELGREFHQMATSLIEREKTIVFQTARLEEQNKMLLDMGELQKRLQQAEHLAAVGRLSAQVAHEVGNPLHSIGLEAELALDVASQLFSETSTEVSKSASQISLKQSMSSILNSVERLQKIIQNYLRLSKLSPEHQSKIDLKDIIETALATYANSIEQNQIKVDWTFESHTEIMGDPDLLEYALGNLIRNSIQAPSTEISIRVARTKNEKQVVVWFEDNGPGISGSARANLFKPFFTTKAEGTGLGLSFVKKVFTDLGGDFQLVSTTAGKGTRFEGVLPSLNAPKTQERNPPSARHTPEASA